MDQLNVGWGSIYGGNFTDIVGKTPSTGLAVRKTPYEKKKEQRAIQRNAKNNLENEFEKRAVGSVYGTREAGQRYEQRRKALFFETKAAAANRVAKSKNLLIFF